MGSWLSFPLCGEPETHVPAPMNGLVASVLLQLPFFKHMCASHLLLALLWVLPQVLFLWL